MEQSSRASRLRKFVVARLGFTRKSLGDSCHREKVLGQRLPFRLIAVAMQAMSKKSHDGDLLLEASPDTFARPEGCASTDVLAI
jgi:hypothetical protein